MNSKLALLTFITITTPTILMADMDRCVSCHGVDFEVKALKSSKIVKDMSEKEIKIALDGYKKGEGGLLKGIMMSEVNLGVDTDAMAADVYNEAHTKGFKEPNDEFIFQKRLSVKTLHKIQTNIKNSDPEKDLPKVVSQMKSAAFTMLSYDKSLNDKINFNLFKNNKPALNMGDILTQVSEVKRCVDHSFSENDIEKCRTDFINLTGSLTYDEAIKIKAKSKKAPIYTGEGAIDISKYLD